MSAEFSPEHLDALRRAYVGRMRKEETEFLWSVQAFIEEALHEGLGFVAVMQTLQENIRGLGRFRFSLGATDADGQLTPLDSGRLKATRLAKEGSPPPSESEAEFLRDIQGMIDYSIRNDLSFKLVVSTLGHDINGIAHYGFDLDTAAADYFLPKVSGFAGSVADSVGAPDESSD